MPLGSLARLPYAWTTSPAERTLSASGEVVGIFRLTAPADGRYRYLARGLRAGRRYRVTLDNSGESVELLGLELERDGLEVWLESPLTSEMLLVEGI